MKSLNELFEESEGKPFKAEKVADPRDDYPNLSVGTKVQVMERSFISDRLLAVELDEKETRWSLNGEYTFWRKI